MLCFNTPWRFNGKELDPETGNYYYGARYYDPKVSVWLSVDPLADQRPNLTPYNFMSNNPVMRIDPTGMLDTRYEDEDGNEILTTYDGSNDVVVVKNEDRQLFEAAMKITTWGNGNKPEWNKAWKEYLSRENTSSTGSTSNGFNLDRALDYLNNNAAPSYNKNCGNCAKAVRLAIDAGGINTNERATKSISAKDYGANLSLWGFEEISSEGYIPQKGDVRIIQPSNGTSRHGHMNMFNGKKWVSDFVERDFWPGPTYRKNKPSYSIYRYNGSK